VWVGVLFQSAAKCLILEPTARGSFDYASQTSKNLFKTSSASRTTRSTRSSTAPLLEALDSPDTLLRRPRAPKPSRVSLPPRSPSPEFHSFVNSRPPSPPAPVPSLPVHPVEVEEAFLRFQAITSRQSEIIDNLLDRVDNFPLPVAAPAAQPAMAQPIPMPISGDRHAPTFDPAQPRTLSRYFDNLDELLARAQIITDADRKKYAIRYVTIDVADQWEELDSYTGGSYIQWKAEVFALYPGADSTVRYTRQGLLEYVNHWKTRGFRTIGDWAEFYRNYSTQSKWLINRTVISSIDQKRWCEDAIGAQMSSIATRLQVKLPDVHPGDGYPLNELDAAMRFLLHGTSTALSAPVAAPAPTPVVMPIVPSAATTASPPAIKSEDIGRLLEYFQRLLPAANQQASSSVPQNIPSRAPAASERCHYCGREGE
jgi:hypothetical protein